MSENKIKFSHLSLENFVFKPIYCVYDFFYFEKSLADFPFSFDLSSEYNINI